MDSETSLSSLGPTSYIFHDNEVEVKIEMEEEEETTTGDVEDLMLLHDHEGNCNTTEGYLPHPNLEEGEGQDNNITLVDPMEIETTIVSSTVDVMPSPEVTLQAKYPNKKQFTLEMEKNIQDIINECISVLQKDPREYQPFYLRIFKYTTIGEKIGFIKSGKEVDSLWQKYDDFAKSQFQKWESEGYLLFNGEYSPYLNYVLTKKVIISGQVIPLKQNKQERRNETFKKLGSMVKSFHKKWTQTGVSSYQEIRDNLKYRLEFFECVKHITYPGDTVTINNHWSMLINGFSKTVDEKECKPNLPVAVKRCSRERKRPIRFEPIIEFSTRKPKGVVEIVAKKKLLSAVTPNKAKESVEDSNKVTGGNSAEDEEMKTREENQDHDEPKLKKKKRNKSTSDMSLSCPTKRAIDGGQCPYCPKYMQWRLQRHILEVHCRSDRKNKPRADLQNMTADGKREFRKIQAKRYRADMTPEEAEQVKRYHREKYLANLAKMSAEERLDFKAKRRFYELQRRLKNQDLSEEEKERRRTINYVKKQAYLASKPKEWLEEKEEKRKQRVKEKVWSMTDEQREERRKKHRDYINNLTGEKLQRYRESMRRGLRKYLTRLKKEDPQEYWNKTTGGLKKRWKDWLKYQRSRVQNENPRDREARLLRYRINQAKRKEKHKLEQEGAGQDEINTRLKIVEELVRSQPRPAKASVYKPRKGARKPHNVANAKLRPPNWDKDDSTGQPPPVRKLYLGKRRGRPKKEVPLILEPAAAAPQNVEVVALPPAPSQQPLVTILTPFRQVTLPIAQSQQQQQLQPQMQQPIITLVQPTSITFQVISSSNVNSTSQETFTLDGTIHHISACSGSNYDNNLDSSHYTTSQLTQYTNGSFVETVPVTMVSTDSTILFSPVITTTTIQMSDIFASPNPAEAIPQEAQILELEIPIDTELIVRTDDTTILEPEPEPEDEPGPEPDNELEQDLIHEPVGESEQKAEPVGLHEPVEPVGLHEPAELTVVVEQKPCPPSRQAGICDECGKSFTTNFSLQVHKHIAHPADPSILICPKCQISCSSTVTLWNHFVAYHLEDVDAFPEEHFPKKRELLPKRPKTEPYVQKRFDPNIINGCEHCGKKFVQKCTLDDHIRRVHEGKGHYCDLCGRDQQSAAKLWRHKVERHDMMDLKPPDGVPAVTCKYCGEIVMRGYEKHVQKRHPEEIADFHQWYVPELGTAPKRHIPVTKVKCPQCPSILSSKLLNRHIKQIHMDRPKHPCPECGFQFKRLDHMRKHYRDQHALAGIEKRLEAKQFIKVLNERHFSAICLLCHTDLPARTTVRAHFVQAHHEIFEQCQVASLPIFECQICEEKFSKELQLKNHMEKAHPDKVYPCQHCGILKYSEEELKKHEISHRKNEVLRKKRRGICELCDFDCRASIPFNIAGMEVGIGEMFKLLRQHVQSQHPDNFLPCPNENCLKYGINPVDFRNHLAKCQKRWVVKSKQFVEETVARIWVYCPKCRISIRLYLLHKHLISAHKMQSNKEYACEQCVGLVFKNQKYYVAHMHLVHQLPFDELLDLAPERTFKLKTGGRPRGTMLLNLASKKKGNHSSKRFIQESSEDEETEFCDNEEDVDWNERNVLDDDMENNNELGCSREIVETKNRLKRGKTGKIRKIRKYREVEIPQLKSRRGRKPKLDKKFKEVFAEPYMDLEREKKLVVRVERMSDDLMNFYLARQIVIKVEPED